MTDFLLSYFLTILIEGLVLYLLLCKRYGARLIVSSAIIASSLTIPFVWFLFPVFGFQFPVLGFGSWVVQTALAEIFAVIVETGVYHILFVKISWKNAFFASLICNATSFGIGFVVF